jgi:hypothetical protein
VVESLGSDETTAFFPGLAWNTAYRVEVGGIDHDNMSYYSSGPITIRTPRGWKLVFTAYTLIKKKIKFSSYIRKFIVGAVAKSYMRKTS